jgi:hypothetical protein
VKIAKAKRVVLPDQNLTQVQNTLGDVLDKVCDVPYISGVHIRDVELTAGSNSVAHKLGRTPLGWIVTKVVGDVGTTAVTVPYDPQPVKIRQSVAFDVEVVAAVGVNSTKSITLPRAPRNGSTCLVCFVGSRPVVASEGIDVPVQTGATYSVGHALSPGSTISLFTWYAQNVQSAGTGITLTQSATNIAFNGTIIFIELTGVAAASFQSKDSLSATAGGASANIACSTSITPSTNDTFFISFNAIHAALTTLGNVILGPESTATGSGNTFNLRLEYVDKFRYGTGAAAYARPIIIIAGHPQHQSVIEPALYFNAGSQTWNNSAHSNFLFLQDTSGSGSTNVATAPAINETDADSNYLTLETEADVTVDLWVF